MMCAVLGCKHRTNSTKIASLEEQLLLERREISRRLACTYKLLVPLAIAISMQHRIGGEILKALRSGS